METVNVAQPTVLETISIRKISLRNVVVEAAEREPVTSSVAGECVSHSATVHRWRGITASVSMLWSRQRLCLVSSVLPWLEAAQYRSSVGRYHIMCDINLSFFMRFGSLAARSRSSRPAALVWNLRYLQCCCTISFSVCFILFCCCTILFYFIFILCYYFVVLLWVTSNANERKTVCLLTACVDLNHCVWSSPRPQAICVPLPRLDVGPATAAQTQTRPRSQALSLVKNCLDHSCNLLTWLGLTVNCSCCMLQLVWSWK